VIKHYSSTSQELDVTNSLSSIPALEWALFTLMGVVGLFVGSFLNVVIHRGPAMWNLVDEKTRRGDLLAPRSYCPSCGAPIPSWRLIPLVSYFLQNGWCHSCKTPISIRYPIVEAMGACVALCALFAFGVSWAALFASIFGWALITLAMIDLETGFLPDAITLPLIAIGLLVNGFDQFALFPDAIIGAFVGYCAFRIIGIAFKAARGREGLGQGDAKLLAAIGAWCGWAALPTVVFLGAVATLAVVGIRHATGKSIASDAEIPFGPGLCLAGFVVLAAAQRLISGL
jgi:leader peptidase (prepilin peptidase)/N-methyltransferase